MSRLSVARKRQNESGANLVEYILLVAFIAIIVIVAVKVLAADHVQTVDAQVCGLNNKDVLTSQGFFTNDSASKLQEGSSYRFMVGESSHKIKSVTSLAAGVKAEACVS